MRCCAEYFFGWTGIDGRAGVVPSGRRRLGVITLLCGSVIDSSRQTAMPAAIACELAFGSALIHDDVIDADLTRRGRPAVWSAFGMPAAILTGNALVGLAFAILVEAKPAVAAESSGRLARAVQEVNRGQMLDVEFERRADVTVEDYLDMVAAKSGAFVACGCALGALLAGAGAELVDGLAEFGNRLGLIWQLNNDLLGIWGDPTRTGKPALSDIKARKKTFPVISALSTAGPNRDRLRVFYGSGGQEAMQDDEATLAADLVERCGGLGRTQSEIEYQLDKAMHFLSELVPDRDSRTQLADLACFYAGSDR
ncbi:family 2 encapsulin nanocompartment cargo protein polyprenyl transferase [Nocardia sp. JMUB6875]